MTHLKMKQENSKENMSIKRWKKKRSSGMQWCIIIKLQYKYSSFCSEYSRRGYILSPQYTVLHILLIMLFGGFFYLCLYIFSCVVLQILHWPLSGPDLIYISLLTIFCIIEYVTNKTTLKLLGLYRARYGIIFNMFSYLLYY